MMTTIVAVAVAAIVIVIEIETATATATMAGTAPALARSWSANDALGLDRPRHPTLNSAAAAASQSQKLAAKLRGTASS